MHPGDPAGSAGNIINCRCVLLFEKEKSIMKPKPGDKPSQPIAPDVPAPFVIPTEYTTSEGVKGVRRSIKKHKRTKDYDEASFNLKNDIDEVPKGNIEAYTASSYKGWNSWLRGDKEKLLFPDHKSNISNIQNVFNDLKIMKFSGNTYRGVSFQTPEKQKVFVDSIKAAFVDKKSLEMDGFTSTSVLKSRAFRFVNQGLESSKVVFKIKTKNGLAINTVSSFSTEKEVLLAHKSNFKINKIMSKQQIGTKKITLIELEEIDIGVMDISKAKEASKSMEPNIKATDRTMYFVEQSPELAFMFK